jgi:hypothetical protein
VYCWLFSLIALSGFWGKEKLEAEPHTPQEAQLLVRCQHWPMASSRQPVTGASGSNDAKTEAAGQRQEDVAALVAIQAREVLQVIFAWRLINAYFVRTFFQPDEYFQALEPAWQLAYGEGNGAWLTWVCQAATSYQSSLLHAY